MMDRDDGEAQLVTTWGDTAHWVWNAIVVVIGVVALYAIARIPHGRFSNGWKTKAGWIAAAFLTSVSVAGYAIPVGLLLWPAAVRSSRRCRTTVPSANRQATSGYTVPGYGDVGRA
jgi:hypothetical protein